MEDDMKTRSGLFLLFAVAAMIVLTACGGAAATQAPAATEAPAGYFAAEQWRERCRPNPVPGGNLESSRRLSDG